MTTSTDKKTKVVTKDKPMPKDKQVKREPVVPSSNKLVSARWEDKCREIHLQKLKSMKPAIDNVPPKEYPHLTNNKKRLQLQEDRMAEMERQNGILLNKLYRIQTRSKGDETMLKDGSRALNPGEACRNRVHSLNSTARKQELERIAVENVAILRRIQEVSTRNTDTHIYIYTYIHK